MIETGSWLEGFQLPAFLLGWFLAAYLLGSIPVAWLLTKLVSGKDLRQLGSGNVGVMNTMLSTARWVGLLVFLSEAGKGILAVAAARLSGQGEALAALAMVGVVAGTRWPVWLRFKGGRGNTSGFTALLFIAPAVMVFLVVLWGVLRALLKNSFWATRLVILSMPLAVWTATRSWELTAGGAALMIFYLNAQVRESDDHLRIKETWHSFWGFLTTPPRRRY